MDEIVEIIKEQLAQNPVVLYMKGTPQFPQCGFSARAVEVLSGIGKPFAYVNILDAPEIRQGMKDFANWPTFPQLWVKGELVGGSDIVAEMGASGELAKLLEEAVPAAAN